MLRVIAILLFLFSSGPIRAQIFEVTGKKLDQKSQGEVRTFINQTLKRLPPKIVQNFDEKIQVKFTSLNEGKSLPGDICDPNSNFLIARHHRLSKGHIEIEQSLIEQILKGPNNSKSFDCGHGNFYRLAQATIIHEIAHIYDLKNLRPYQDQEELSHCQRQRDRNDSPSLSQLSSKCELLLKNNRRSSTVSDLLSFQKLSNWNMSLFGNSAKNKFAKRSPDLYEFESLEEHFAVNMEFFLLDPDYACKRPSYHRYFVEKFNFTPFPEVDCEVFSKIEIDDKDLLIDLDPERVYRIDYLLASKGDSVISGFGHSMFRVVLCAPFRKEVSEKCLEDKLYHVVLSYRANVTDVKSDALKGLVGGYDSILFMLSFPDVVKEYNIGELRDLYSIPLELNKKQKRAFIERSLEVYWQYRGNYKFITQNCATESLELLQSSLPEHEVTTDSSLLPYGLVDIFEKHGLVDPKNFSDSQRARDLGMFFESDKKRLNKIKREFFGDEQEDYVEMRRLNRRREFRNLPKPKRKKSIRDILAQTPYERLKSQFEELTDIENLSKSKRRKTQKKLDRLSILVQGLVEIKKKDLDEDIGGFLEKYEDKPTELGKMVTEWNESKKSQRFIPVDGHYGIPLFIAQKDKATFAVSEKGSEEIRQELLDEIQGRFQEKIDNVINLQRLVENIRHKSNIISLKNHL